MVVVAAGVVVVVAGVVVVVAEVVVVAGMVVAEEEQESLNSQTAAGLTVNPTTKH